MAGGVQQIALGFGKVSIGVVEGRLPGLCFTQEPEAHPIGEALVPDHRKIQPGAILLTFANRECFEVLTRALRRVADANGWAL